MNKFEYNIDQINYIMFVLVGDSFEISELLRERAKDWGMDVLYDRCEIIAHAFAIYDYYSDNQSYMSEYDSLWEFLRHYDDDIKSFINYEQLDLVNLVRSDYEQN